VGSIILEVIASILMLGGSFFAVVGALGLVRLPDLYTRLHASSKVVTLGVGGVALGSLLASPTPSVAGKILLAIAFLFLTAPISSHAIGRARYYSGVRMCPETVSDEYERFAILDRREKLLKARVKGRAWLGEKRQRQVFELADQHMQQTLRAVRIMKDAVLDFLKGDIESMESETSSTISIENEVDGLAMEALEVISKSELSPENREDLLNLVYHIRSVGTAAKALAFRLQLAEEYEFPDAIVPGLRNLTSAVTDTVETLASAIAELNRDLVLADELANLVSELEDHVDNVRRNLVKLLLRQARAMDPATFFVINEVIMRLEDLADACENTADRIRLISVKYVRML